MLFWISPQFYNKHTKTSLFETSPWHSQIWQLLWCLNYMKSLNDPEMYSILIFCSSTSVSFTSELIYRCESHSQWLVYKASSSHTSAKVCCSLLTCTKDLGKLVTFFICTSLHFMRKSVCVCGCVYMPRWLLKLLRFLKASGHNISKCQSNELYINCF